MATASLPPLTGATVPTGTLYGPLPAAQQAQAVQAGTASQFPPRLSMSGVTNPNPFPQMSMRGSQGFGGINNPNRGLISATSNYRGAKAADVAAKGKFPRFAGARAAAGPGVGGVMGGFAIGQGGNMIANRLGDNAYGNTGSAAATGGGLGFMAAGSAAGAGVGAAGVGAGELLSRLGPVNSGINWAREGMGFGRTDDTVIDLFRPNRGTPLGFVGELLGVEGETDTPQAWGQVKQLSGGNVVRASDVRATLDELEAAGQLDPDIADGIVVKANALANERIAAGGFTYEQPTGEVDDDGKPITNKITFTDPEQIRAVTWAEAQQTAIGVAQQRAQEAAQQEQDMGRVMAMQQALAMQMAPYMDQANQLQQANQQAIAPLLANIPAQYQAPMAATSRSIADLNSTYQLASLAQAWQQPAYQAYQDAQQDRMGVANQLQQWAIQEEMNRYLGVGSAGEMDLDAQLAQMALQG